MSKPCSGVVQVRRLVGAGPEQIERIGVAGVTQSILLERLNDLAAHAVTELEVEHVGVGSHRVEVEPFRINAVVRFHALVVPQRDACRCQVHVRPVPDIEVAIDLALGNHEPEQAGLVPERLGGPLVVAKRVIFWRDFAFGVDCHLRPSRRLSLVTIPGEAPAAAGVVRRSPALPPPVRRWFR